MLELMKQPEIKTAEDMSLYFKARNCKFTTTELQWELYRQLDSLHLLAKVGTFEGMAQREDKSKDFIVSLVTDDIEYTTQYLEIGIVYDAEKRVFDVTDARDSDRRYPDFNGKDLLEGIKMCAEDNIPFSLITDMPSAKIDTARLTELAM